ncbi:MAG: VWA domain-containing protein, partial [Burkholderiaceae bacterium]
GRGSADDADAGASHHAASREESLASSDFRDLNRSDDARDIEALMRRFARRLKHLQLRREARSHHGRRIDLQSTIRRSVASGGTPLRLAWKQRRRVRPRLLLLLDVSRSMSLYSFFYLRLARALCAELADVHCFIFHTHITGIAQALRDPDPWRSQERLHLLAAGWGGGTRIGECLRHFNHDQGARLVHSRTGVIVVSDGYDTGDPQLLAQALATLRQRARRVVWLNPLLNQSGFSPQSQGMQAAMPHLDLLAAGADLIELERLLPQIIESLR